LEHTLQDVADVLEQVPSVGHLYGVRSPSSRTLGVDCSATSRDASTTGRTTGSCTLWADEEWAAPAFVTNALDWDEDELAQEYAPHAGSSR
jgi:hypothetical protein